MSSRFPSQFSLKVEKNLLIDRLSLERFILSSNETELDATCCTGYQVSDANYIGKQLTWVFSTFNTKFLNGEVPAKKKATDRNNLNLIELFFSMTRLTTPENTSKLTLNLALSSMKHKISRDMKNWFSAHIFHCSVFCISVKCLWHYVWSGNLMYAVTLRWLIQIF